jgi:hypothetical protein
VIRATTSLAILASLALLVCLNGAAIARDKTSRDKPVPSDLAPPASSHYLFELGARGVQNYDCKADPNAATAFVWTFRAPEAELVNARGEVAGRHLAGPTWQGNDGSAVVGKVVARADVPNRKAIPWLLLEATGHDGSGAFSTITFIQRLDTSGGLAPRDGCDAAHSGAEARVPYEATYAFYYPASPLT